MLCVLDKDRVKGWGDYLLKIYIFIMYNVKLPRSHTNAGDLRQPITEPVTTASYPYQLAFQHKSMIIYQGSDYE